MEKTNGREATALSTVRTGIENPELETMVIHRFSFCGALWLTSGPHVGSMAAHNPHQPWQDPMTDRNSTCVYRKKD